MSDIISGVAQAGATVAQGVMNYMSQGEANEQNVAMFNTAMDFNRFEAAKAREYNTYMASTAHQREMADLKAAGINPMLTAMGGSGAPSPTSPAASTSSGNAVKPRELGALSAALPSAIAAAKTLADIRNTDKDTILKEAGALAQTATANSATANARQAEEVTNQLKRSRDANAAEADAKKNKATLDQQYMATERLLGTIKQGSGIVNDASSAVSRFLPTKILGDFLKNKSYKDGAKNMENQILNNAGSQGIPLP